MRINQENIKEAQEQKVMHLVNPSELVTIRLSSVEKNIFWEENGKEFALNGMMYDVVKIENKNGETFIYCISDVKEKELVAHFNAAITKQNAADRKEKVNIDNLIDLFISHSNGKTPLIGVSNNNSYSPYKFCLQSADEKNYSPPPEVLGFV